MADARAPDVRSMCAIGLSGQRRDKYPEGVRLIELPCLGRVSALHIVEAARMGADICTCPAAVIEAMFKHPLTDIGLEKFLKDWEKAHAVKA